MKKTIRADWNARLHKIKFIADNVLELLQGDDFNSFFFLYLTVITLIY